MSNGNMNGNLNGHGHLSGVLTIGLGGTSDYNELENRPSINNIILEGNKTAHELNLASMQDVSDIASDLALLSQKLPKNYSTDEQNTGVKWIDGKYIYQRTFNVNSFSSSVLLPVNVSYIIKFYGYIETNDTKYFIPYADGTDFVAIYYNDSGVYLSLSGWFTQRSINAYFTLYYTKNE